MSILLHFLPNTIILKLPLRHKTDSTDRAAVKKDGVPRGAIPVVLMRNLAVGNTYTMIIYVQGGKLEGSEISEKNSEKEVKSLLAVKKDGVPRGAVPVVRMRNLAVGNTFLRHGGFPPKITSETAHHARFLEGQPRV